MTIHFHVSPIQLVDIPTRQGTIFTIFLRERGNGLTIVHGDAGGIVKIYSGGEARGDKCVLPSLLRTR